MSDLISVIVPVYNVEKYLDKCIRSLTEQDYENLEIILIDDGSTDSSGTACDKWAEKDHRIKVIHSENQGQAAARNLGIDKASGKYFAFVDSDDEVSNVIYEVMYTYAEKYGADIVTCDHTVERSSLYHGVPENCRFQVIDSPLEHYLEKEGHSVWRRLYKSSLFDGIRFPNVKHDEDVLIMYSLLERCKKTVFIDEKLYFWNQEPSSLSRGSVKSLANRSMEIYKKVVNEHPEVSGYAKIRALQSSYRTFTRVLRFGLAPELRNEFLCEYKTQLQFLRKNISLMRSSSQFSSTDILKVIAVQIAIPFYALRLKLKLK